MNDNRRYGKIGEKRDYDQKIIDIRRVARIVAGGRRFSFRVTVIAGDRNGSVGVGLGKAAETSAAIIKAYNNAVKNKITVPITKTQSIPQATEAKYSSCKILIKPSPKGGLIAGSSAKSVLELAGIRDVNAKVISRSKNKLNIARAAVAALSKIR